MCWDIGILLLVAVVEEKATRRSSSCLVVPVPSSRPIKSLDRPAAAAAAISQKQHRPDDLRLLLPYPVASSKTIPKHRTPTMVLPRAATSLTPSSSSMLRAAAVRSTVAQNARMAQRYQLQQRQASHAAELHSAQQQPQQHEERPEGGSQSTCRCVRGYGVC